MVLDSVVAEYVRSRGRSGDSTRAAFDPFALRREESALRHRYGRGPDMAAVENHDVAVSNGSITVRLLWPSTEPDAVVVYYHGGGWVVGDIDDYDALARALARDTGCVVALVNYRKAPEHPHPTAVIDAVEGARWAEAEVRRLMGRRLPLIVAGDSAGGNLAAVLAQMSAVVAAPQVDLQVLIYPVLDCRTDTPSYRDPENNLLLTREYMEWFWEQYVPDVACRANVTASPGRANSLRGLPPAVIVAAEHDVLRAEGESYALRLQADGVDVSYKAFTGQIHGFFSLHKVLPASDVARAWVAGEITRYLHGAQPAHGQISRKVP
jgi:acetyl esterase